MTPSQQPLPDRRKNIELSDDEVQMRIAERHEIARRSKNQTIGGLILGVVGVAIAAYSGLITGAIWMTILGFVMALIGFGFSSPKEAVGLVRSILGRNG